LPYGILKPVLATQCICIEDYGNLWSRASGHWPIMPRQI
jgi:hypothetical protein